MSKQEIDQVEVIARDDFRAGGQLVKKDEPFQCTKGTAKQLVATGKARWPDKAEAEETADTTEGDPAKLEAAKTATQAGTEGTGEKDTEATTEQAPAKADEPKAAKNTKASK